MSEEKIVSIFRIINDAMHSWMVQNQSKASSVSVGVNMYQQITIHIVSKVLTLNDVLNTDLPRDVLGYADMIILTVSKTF